MPFRFLHASRITHHVPLIAHCSLLIALTLLGLLLRRYRLGAYGLWFDEADLVARAHEPLAGLLAAFVRPGENGPLFTVLVAAWLRLAGDAELTVRLPSVLAGTLAIPALALLGRALGGWRVGLLAAGLLAVSPYAVWYSQDAKMYALLTLLVPVTWWLLLRALGRPRPAWWLAYGLLTIAGFFIHVSMVLVWLSQVLVVLLHWRRLGAARRPWAIVTLLLLLPELVVGLWQATYLLGGAVLGSWQPSVGLGEMLGVLAVKLAVNRADPATEWWGALLFAGLAAAGLVAWARGGQAASDPADNGAPAAGLRPAVLLAGALVVPTVLFYLVTLRVPLFQDRYLIVLLPPYLLLVAGALAWLTRRLWPLALVGLAALLLTAWIPLRDVVYSAEPQKEDWVSAYRYIAAHMREGDVLLIHPGYLRPTADYYARRFPNLARLPVVTLPSLRTEDFDERELDAVLATATWGKTRVWLVTGGPERLGRDDPRDLLRTWYRGNTRLFADRLFNGVRVETFSYNGPYKAGVWRPEIPLRVEFGGEIALVGATWDVGDVAAGRRVRAGDWALLTLRWRALRPVTASYVVRVRLRDAAGREVDQYDIKPLDGHYPTEQWTTREQIWDYHDLFIQPDLPPGTYSVVVGLYPAGQPAAGLRPDSGAAPGDPLGVEVGSLTIVR